MSVHRCPRCGTILASEDEACSVCSVLPGGRSNHIRPLPPLMPAEESTRRDWRRSSTLLRALAILGMLGFASFVPGSSAVPYQRIAALGLLAVGLGALAASFQGPRAAGATGASTSPVERTGRIVLKGFAVVGAAILALVALTFGFMLLALVVCAAVGVTQGVMH